MQGKSIELKNIFIATANSNFTKTQDVSAALFAGTKAVSIAELKNAPKKVKAPKVPSHVQAIRDLSADAFTLAKANDTLDIKQSKSITAANFNSDGQLILLFDNGDKIITAQSGFKEYIEQHITVAPNIDIVSSDSSVVINRDGNTFDLNVSQSSGQVSIESPDGSLHIVQNGSAYHIQVSEASPASNLVVEVRNQTGQTLTKGTAVYISGAAGNKPLVSKALATSDQTSAQTLGLVSNDILHNQNGYVTIVGLVTDLNTLAFPEGSQLYLSPTIAGTYTTVKHHAPYHMVYVGVVTRSHKTQGTIQVKVQNGYELDELHDVLIVDPEDNQFLTYDITDHLWKNKTLVIPDASTTNSYFNKISTVANEPFIITHNLNLHDRDSFTINTMLNNSQVQTSISSLSTNSLSITTSVNTTNLAVTIMGIKA